MGPEFTGSTPRRSALLSATLLAVLTILLTSVSSASALSIGLMWSGDYGQLAPEMEQVEHSGATVFRFCIDESVAGGFSYDSVFESAWEHGITIEPCLLRSNVPAGAEGARFPSSGEYAAWNVWVTQIVKRYGYNGTFWNGKPNPKPVPVWEVWNEPNLPANNPGGSSVQPENYGRFLVSTAAAIRQAQSEQSGGGTTVLFGGLYMPAGESYNSFLEKAANVSGEPAAYDGVGIHPYSFWGKVTEMTAKIEDVRYTLDHNVAGGTGKSLWIGELGWPLANPNEGKEGNPIKPVTEAQQASLLTESFNWIKGAAAADNIQAAIWYNVRDAPLPPAGKTPHWDSYSGLRDRSSGAYRPSWWAFQEETGAPMWPAPPPPARVSYADSSNLNTVSVWEHGSGGPWGQTFFWGDPVAAASSPETLEFGGTKHVFYVDSSKNNTITDWSWNPSTGWQQTFLWGHPVAEGTTPSAVVANGTMHIFYVDASNGNTLTDWSWNTSTGWQQTSMGGHSVAAGSSPSAMMVNGYLQVYFADAVNSNSITAWVLVPGYGWSQAFLYGHPVAAGTSPSVVMEGGTPHVLFVDASNGNTLTDWTWNSGTGWQQVFLYGHPVVAGSSPSAMMVNGYLEVFFADAASSNSITAWVLVPGYGWSQAFLYGDPVAAGTSPSAVMEGGTPNVYFVDAAKGNTLTDWTWNSSTGWQQTYLYGHPVAGESSPSGF